MAVPLGRSGEAAGLFRDLQIRVRGARSVPKI